MWALRLTTLERHHITIGFSTHFMLPNYHHKRQITNANVEEFFFITIYAWDRKSLGLLALLVIKKKDRKSLRNCHSVKWIYFLTKKVFQLYISTQISDVINDDYVNVLHKMNNFFRWLFPIRLIQLFLLEAPNF